MSKIIAYRRFFKKLVYLALNIMKNMKDICQSIAVILSTLMGGVLFFLNFNHSFRDFIIGAFLGIFLSMITINFIFALHSYFRYYRQNLNDNVNKTESIEKNKGSNGSVSNFLNNLGKVYNSLFSHDYDKHIICFLLESPIFVIIFVSLVEPSYLSKPLYQERAIHQIYDYILELINNNPAVFLPFFGTLIGMIAIYFGFILYSQRAKKEPQKQLIWIHAIEFLNNLVIGPSFLLFGLWIVLGLTKGTLNLEIPNLLIIILLMTLFYSQVYIRSRARPKEGWDKYQELIKRIIAKPDTTIQCMVYSTIILFLTWAIMLTDITIIPIALVLWVDMTSFSMIALKYAFDKKDYYLVDIEFTDDKKIEKAILVNFENSYLRIVPKDTESYCSVLLNMNEIKSINYYGAKDVKKFV